jgi:peptide-methionine (R)-S-oxide reductase
VALSDAEWEERLTPAQFRVLRRHGTEAPFSGPSVTPDAEGRYCCAGCGAALFRADTKFDSGTGWPSFGDAERENVELRRDLRLGSPRTEVRCRRCGGHLGHVFGDGPGPTGKRYCINACALASGDDAGREV